MRGSPTTFALDTMYISYNRITNQRIVSHQNTSQYYHRICRNLYRHYVYIKNILIFHIFFFFFIFRLFIWFYLDTSFFLSLPVFCRKFFFLFLSLCVCSLPSTAILFHTHILLHSHLHQRFGCFFFLSSLFILIIKIVTLAAVAVVVVADCFLLLVASVFRSHLACKYIVVIEYTFFFFVL